MTGHYLEVTFRKGRPIAAYYYLPRRPGQKSFRTMLADPGIVVDFSRSGKPIGIEITAPSKISLAAVNRVFRKLGLATIKSTDLAPLLAAWRSAQNIQSSYTFSKTIQNQSDKADNA